ncbi:hypothetical protein [Leifsonia sp. ALI-44-B]|uniref:hypothetical protein n=1 Tax=Leifsonia sp. ALI-44-B TaxID=1933776 RepID=UPI00117B8165|nr:hypothetical protein [Leifsonia sp. ALI-44-B]
MRNASKLMTVGVLTTLLTGGVVMPAAAHDPASATVDALERVAPDALDGNVQAPTDGVDDIPFHAELAEGDVSLPTAVGAPVTIDTPEGGIKIELPFATNQATAQGIAPGVVAYDNANGTTTVSSVKQAGALQFTTVIETSAAPTEFSYDIAVPEGGSILEGTGGYFILDSDGEPVATIAAPWALDANGASVPTRYEFAGTTLTQVVEHASTKVVYPVVADPKFEWFNLLPTVKLTRSETSSARTATGLATVCGWAARTTGYLGGAVCGLNAGSIIVNANRAYGAGKCLRLLIGPGVVGGVPYKDGYCR